MTGIEYALRKYCSTKQHVDDLEAQLMNLSESTATADEYAERIRGITAQLSVDYNELRRIEESVSAADMSEAELQYVQLRYFAGRRHATAAAQMELTLQTAGRIRTAALSKIKL